MKMRLRKLTVYTLLLPRGSCTNRDYPHQPLYDCEWQVLVYLADPTAEDALFIVPFHNEGNARVLCVPWADLTESTESGPYPVLVARHFFYPTRYETTESLPPAEACDVDFLRQCNNVVCKLYSDAELPTVEREFWNRVAATNQPTESSQIPNMVAWLDGMRSSMG